MLCCAGAGYVLFREMSRVLEVYSAKTLASAGGKAAEKKHVAVKPGAPASVPIGFCWSHLMTWLLVDRRAQ